MTYEYATDRDAPAAPAPLPDVLCPDCTKPTVAPTTTQIPGHYCPAKGGFVRYEPIRRTAPLTLEESDCCSSLIAVRRQIMDLYGGNLDHPAIDHINAALSSISRVAQELRRGDPA